MKKDKKNKRPGRLWGAGIFAVVCGVFIWLSVTGVYSFLSNASYFRVKRVSFIGLNEKQAAEEISKKLIYDNIFLLDINEIAQNLKDAYPQFYDVAIARHLPDALVVKVVVRKPRAQIKQKNFFLVDSEGVIVSDASERPFTGYIIIEGLKALPSLSFGKTVRSQALASGLQLAEMLSAHKKGLLSFVPAPAGDVAIRIDLDFYPNLYVYLDALELRFHRESFQRQLKSLFDILPSLGKRISQVKYIDLRFQDPAVSF